MVSTFTANIQLEEPARGDQVNAWTTAINNIMTCLDLAHGGILTLSATALPVTLSAVQFKNKTLTFNSTLTANVTVTFPSSFTKSYEVQNLCSGTSAFTITLATTVAGGQVICAPPGETVGFINNGSNLTYKALHRVGDYWDHAGAAVPNWVSGCTVPPYISCDGSTFSAATYPALAVQLAGTTLPDSRGRCRWTLNQATGRITAGISGVDGNTRFAGGGNESMQSHTHSVSDPSHNHAHNFNQNNGGAIVGSNNATGVPTAAGVINAAVTGISLTNTGGGAAQNMMPAYIGGITMIRAA
jgi:hypothetical protein